jgi:acetyl esterase/lipase
VERAVDECDPIRDQGFLHAELLRDAGVLTQSDYYRGMPNMFVQFPELPMTATAGWRQAASGDQVADAREKIRTGIVYSKLLKL